MTRQAGFQVQNNLTRGLITEATGLNFPENACSETYDCIFSEKGKVTRRLGFDYEGDKEFDSVNKTDCAFVEFIWTSAGGVEDQTIVVVQMGSTLHYYISETDESLSSGHIADTTDLLTFEVGSGTDVKGTPCQFAQGNGYLFVVHPLCEPFYVAYTASGPTMAETEITIKCRDFEGDQTDANYTNYDTRPGAITNPHKYNLYNQGWYQTVRTDGGSDAVAFTYWDSNRSDFPSNADIWWVFKDADDELNLGFINRFALGNTPAPKGHYILNEFDTNRTTLSGVTATERDSDDKRPSTVAFFTGRIWYSGINALEYNQKIYYSQVIQNNTQFGSCYQANDPTSSEQADLLADDGGVITIPDVGKIIKIFAMSGSLMVFGTNGVWSIAGSEGIGFKSTDYAVRKLSSVDSISPLSFVDVYGQPFWWNRDGIFTIGQSDLPGTENVVSVSDTSIKEFLTDIPPSSKLYVKGAFNTRTKIIQWVYRSTAATDNDDLYTYDRILNFNLLSKAFYPWTISQSATAPEIHGIITTRGPFSETVETEVVNHAGTNTIIDSNENIVVISSLSSSDDTISFRYLTTDFVSGTSWNMTWSQSIDDSYVDWAIDSQSLDYSSYFITGYKIHGDAARFFEANYLIVYMTNEGEASAFMQAVWDFASTSSSPRYSNPQQVYGSGLQRDIQQTRKKVRGRGRSLQFKFYSETGMPFTIHGWSTWETGNASV